MRHPTPHAWFGMASTRIPYSVRNWKPPTFLTMVQEVVPGKTFALRTDEAWV